MRLPVRKLSFFAAAAALACFGGGLSQAQNTNVQNSSQEAPPTPVYVAINPLADVSYDNRYDLSLGVAYAHIKAGPPPLHEGANLGGLDLSGSYWLARRWALEGTGRYVVGTSGAGVNDLNIEGPFISETFFAGGPEWLGPHNKHGAFIAHAMIGGAYGKFQQDLRGAPPSAVGFFNDQVALAAVIGGHIDLNRSPRWVFRITPDALYTRYGINYGTKAVYPYWNFGISVGVEYKFKKKR
jgi:hypothetical protein